MIQIVKIGSGSQFGRDAFINNRKCKIINYSFILEEIISDSSTIRK